MIKIIERLAKDSKKRLWIAGEAVIDSDTKLTIHTDNWRIIGIFDTEEAAMEACTKPNHFVGLIKSYHAEACPDDIVKECVFPLKE